MLDDDICIRFVDSAKKSLVSSLTVSLTAKNRLTNWSNLAFWRFANSRRWSCIYLNSNYNFSYHHLSFQNLITAIHCRSFSIHPKETTASLERSPIPDLNFGIFFRGTFVEEVIFSYLNQNQKRKWQGPTKAKCATEWLIPGVPTVEGP